jgi:hypothetical protein
MGTMVAIVPEEDPSLRIRMARTTFAAAHRRTRFTGSERAALRAELTTAKLLGAIARAINDGLTASGACEASDALLTFISRERTSRT